MSFGIQLSVNHYKYKCESFDSQQMAPPDENGISVPDAELTAQTKQLELHAAKCDTIIAQGNEERIRRHRDALRKLASAIDDKKRSIELQKIQNQKTRPLLLSGRKRWTLK